MNRPGGDEPRADAGDADNRFLDREDVARLFARLPDDTEARERLVLAFRPLADHLARRFAGRGEPVEDLAQVASIALVKAVDRFDATREVQFTTYATATIVGELKRHFRDRRWALRVPRHLKETGLEVSRAATELQQSLGRSPTVQEIARRCRISDEEVLEAMDALRAYSTSSLDAPASPDEAAVIDRLGDEDASIELIERWTVVAPLLRELPARERKILHARFFRGLTQTEIAEEIGISQMHVSRLLAQTLRALRDAAGPHSPTG